MTSETPTQREAGGILGQPLAAYVAHKRNTNPRWPWRLIAAQLAEDTAGKVNVSHETLRKWYINADEAAA